MKDYYRPIDEVIVKIFNCNDLNTKKALVLEQFDKMTFKSGKAFKAIRNRVEKTNSIHAIDKAFTDLVLVGEGMKVI